MNEPKHIAFKVWSCSFDWILLACCYPFSISNISSIITQLHSNKLHYFSIKKIMFFSYFVLASIWTFEVLIHGVETDSEYPIFFSLYLLRNQIKNLMIILKFFWMFFELNISFWFKIRLISSSIIFVFH